jgi:tRNA A-37 threonylcarbamoyl transferase component Bud32
VSDLPDGCERVRRGGSSATLRSDLRDELLPLLDRDELDRRVAAGRVAGRGRASAASIELPSGDRAVVRVYRRGGPLGGLLGGWYLGGRRPADEFCVTEAARVAGVPIPEPLAALTWRRGPLCTAAFVSRQIADAVSLEAWLARARDRGGTVPPALVEAVGSAISALFDAGVHHRDLHAGNILVREGAGPPRSQGDADGASFQCWIIDFDRGRIRRPLPLAVRDAMLFRFNRALHKRHLVPRPVTRTDRLRLAARLRPAADRAELKRFVARCAAHAARHAWRYRRNAPPQEAALSP